MKNLEFWKKKMDEASKDIEFYKNELKQTGDFFDLMHLDDAKERFNYAETIYKNIYLDKYGWR